MKGSSLMFERKGKKNLVHFNTAVVDLDGLKVLSIDGCEIILVWDHVKFITSFKSEEGAKEAYDDILKFWNG